MPLSEHEQRILDEIERRLAEEDPKFARAAASPTPASVARARLRRGVAGFAAGLVLLLAGLVTALDNANLLLVFGLVAFAVMLGSLVVMVRAARDIAPTERGGRQRWLEGMERKWRDRFDGDNGRN